MNTLSDAQSPSTKVKTASHVKFFVTFLDEIKKYGIMAKKYDIMAKKYGIMAKKYGIMAK